MRFILVIALIVVPPYVVGQINANEGLEPGTTERLHVSAVTLHYDGVEPIGPIELVLDIEPVPTTQAGFSSAGARRLVAGSLSYLEHGYINLPGRLLECLPLPRPNNAGLVSLYIEPLDDETHWFDEFTSYITIPFGRPSHVSIGGAEFPQYPSVEFAITGKEVRRATFMKADGERNVLREVTDACPQEFVDWASPPVRSDSTPPE